MKMYMISLRVSDVPLPSENAASISLSEAPPIGTPGIHSSSRQLAIHAYWMRA